MVVDSELRIRRLTIDEALPKLDRYLNAAFMAGLPSVRIVHGKGTGALRKKIGDFLTDHHRVKKTRIGTLEEGGAGVTIVKLKE